MHEKSWQPSCLALTPAQTLLPIFDAALLFSNRQPLVPPAASSPAINTKNSRGQPASRPRFIAYEFSDLSIAQRASRNRTPATFPLVSPYPTLARAAWTLLISRNKRHESSASATLLARVLLRRYRKRMYHRNRPRFFVAGRNFYLWNLSGRSIPWAKIERDLCQFYFYRGI